MTLFKTIRAQKLGASHIIGSWATREATLSVKLTLNQCIQMQLDAGAVAVVVTHHFGGTVTLTPAQGRAVLAGGELVIDAMGVRVR